MYQNAMKHDRYMLSTPNPEKDIQLPRLRNDLEIVHYARPRQSPQKWFTSPICLELRKESFIIHI